MRGCPIRETPCGRTGALVAARVSQGVTTPKGSLAVTQQAAQTLSVDSILFLRLKHCHSWHGPGVGVGIL